MVLLKNKICKETRKHSSSQRKLTVYVHEPLKLVKRTTDLGLYSNKAPLHGPFVMPLCILQLLSTGLPPTKPPAQHENTQLLYSP